MNPRRDIPPAHRPLKSLFRALVDLVGGTDAAAACCSVGRSQIASYQNMGDDAFARVDVVADLELAGGEPLITAEMARRGGYALIPLDTRGEGELAAGMARLGRESAEVFTAFMEANADGRVTIDEIDAQIREHQDLLRVVKGNLSILARMRGDRS